MNAIAIRGSQEAMAKAAEEWFHKNQWAAVRGVDEATWSALCNTIYPGAKAESVIMAVDYCRARGLDPLLKPVHIVPMSVRNAQTGQSEWRDVVMPGVGLYRIQADRSGTYAGADEPEFGPVVEKEFRGKNGTKVTVSFPEWCKYTVYKLIGDQIVPFRAKEYWLENYATEGKDSEAPNTMWRKRQYGQIAKCAEAQALRRAWPEIGQEPTAEEMEGKVYMERDITPAQGQAPMLPGEKVETITDFQASAIIAALAGDQELEKRILTKYQVDLIKQLPKEVFNEVQAGIKKIKGAAHVEPSDN